MDPTELISLYGEQPAPGLQTPQEFLDVVPLQKDA